MWVQRIYARSRSYYSEKWYNILYICTYKRFYLYFLPWLKLASMEVITSYALNTRESVHIHTLAHIPKRWVWVHLYVKSVETFNLMRKRKIEIFLCHSLPFIFRVFSLSQSIRSVFEYVMFIWLNVQHYTHTHLHTYNSICFYTFNAIPMKVYFIGLCVSFHYQLCRLKSKQFPSHYCTQRYP